MTFAGDGKRIDSITESGRRKAAKALLLALCWLSVSIAGCNLPAPSAAPTDRPEPPATPTGPPPAAPSPSPEPAQPTLAVTGPEEIVFDWTTDACEPEDIPDLPARAFRDAAGLVHLISAHLVNRAAVGPSLDDLTRECGIVLSSDHDLDPAHHNDNEWIAAVYTEDGETVYAVVHNEYHGWEHGDCASETVDFGCWYNSLTLAFSTDGGETFNHIAPTPGHFVAGLPYPYEAGAGPFGIFEPSNILKAKDGFYYQVVRVDDIHSPEQWSCLMRTADLANPASWRAWDGSGFNLEFLDPYTAAPGADPADHVCAPLAREEIGVMHQSLTYNSLLDRYVLLGLSADHLDGREAWGIYYSFSEDLLTWTHRQLLWELELPWTWIPGDEQPVLYPTLLDPDSPSRSFDVTDGTAYLYFTRFNPGSHLDRDLVRVPVAFFPSVAEAAAADARTHLALDLAQITAGGLETTGRLAAFDGSPLAGRTVELYFTPAEGPGEYAEYVLEGRNPEEATRAILGYRLHSECECLDAAGELFLYDLRFSEGEEGANRVPNPDFSADLAVPPWQGPDLAVLLPSDRGDGRMLHIAAGPGEPASADLAIFPVTGGEIFRAVFGARVPPAAAGTGIFVLIFLDDMGELLRYPVELAPLPGRIGSAETDEAGIFSFIDQARTDGGFLEAVFPGDDRFHPSTAILSISAP